MERIHAGVTLIRFPDFCQLSLSIPVEIGDTCISFMVQMTHRADSIETVATLRSGFRFAPELGDRGGGIRGSDLSDWGLGFGRCAWGDHIRSSYGCNEVKLVYQKPLKIVGVKIRISQKIQQDSEIEWTHSLRQWGAVEVVDVAMVNSATVIRTAKHVLLTITALTQILIIIQHVMKNFIVRRVPPLQIFYLHSMELSLLGLHESMPQTII